MKLGLVKAAQLFVEEFEKYRFFDHAITHNAIKETIGRKERMKSLL